MGLSRINCKGQIIIPKAVRKSLGITEGDYVVIVADGSKAILSPVHAEKPADLKGRLPATNPYPGLERIRQEIGKDLGERMNQEEE